MTTPDLSGKRVLLLGAETELGAEIAGALAEAGGSIALVAASNDAQTAFAVQRLARKVGAPVSQAIDATNEMAVRVMVRQVSKDLGGLDAVVFCEWPAPEPPKSLTEPSVDKNRVLEWMTDAMVKGADSVLHITKYGGRELDRKGGGPLILVSEGLLQRLPPLPKWWPVEIRPHEHSQSEIKAMVLAALAAPLPSG